MKNGLFKKWLAAALCVLALGSTAALAEPDSFGLGDGHNGALTVDEDIVLNSYAPVTGPLAPGNILPVGACAGNPVCFKAGDLVMVLQSAGYTPVPPSGGSATIDISNAGVGRWEFARLDSASGSALTLTAPLVHSYAYEAGKTQVIRVPEYTDLILNAQVSALAWNGSVGGVVALLASGTVTNEGEISASSAGFRGGQYVNGAAATRGCTELDQAATAGGAQKGEGIVEGRYGPVAGASGRGNIANGGGGGVCFKSGGGGGGNLGAGGEGGRSSGRSGTQNDGARLVGGQGGSALTYSMLNHLTFGGGGGAGHGSNNTGVAGGRGGGVVFVRANALTGSGSISASGGSAGLATGDAGSGGGAGGSIYLRFSGKAECGTVTAIGGVGGNSGTALLGPGGGGGGGRVLFQGGADSTCSFNLFGSSAGSQPDTSWTPDGSYFGAKAGSPGNYVTLPGGFVVPAVPTVTTPAHNSFTSNPQPDIKGTATPNTTVVIYIDGVEVGRATSNSAGNYSFPLPAPLAEGPHTVQAATEVDASQSPKSVANTFTVDTVKPAAPFVSAPGDNTYVTTVRPPITGTAEKNSTVTVYIDGVAVGTTKADDSGNWSYTPTTDLGQGPHTVKATSKDAADNVSADSNTNTFTVDTVKPAAPVVSAPDDNDYVTTVRPVITGTAEANSTVTVYIDGVAVGTTKADASGNWSYTPTTDLGQGPHTVKATSTDVAGNVSVDSNTNTFTVDTVKPPAPVVETPINNTYVTTLTPTFTGTAEADSTVSVYIDGVFSGTTIATGGTWSYTPTTPLIGEGAHTVYATSTDAAGNVSVDSNTNTFLVDSVKPVAPTVDAPDEGSYVTTVRPVITGTAENNSTVTVYIDGVEVGTTTADGSGNWSYTPTTDLAQGSHKVKVTSKDAAGNVSVDSNVRTFIVDSIAPVAPVVIDPANGAEESSRPTFTGTAEPGATVTIIVDGEDLGTTTADASGNWTYTIPTGSPGLADGSHTVTARQTDAAGNTSPVAVPENTFTVDSTLPSTTIETKPPLVSNSTTAEFTFSSDKSPVTYECTLDTVVVSCTDTLKLENLAQGSHTLTVRAVDALGHKDPSVESYTWTVDTLAPAAPVVLAPDEGSEQTTTTPVISGTAEPGSTVTVIIDGVEVGTTTTDASGNWSFPTTTPLTPGPHEVTARATDAAGNTSPDSAPRGFTVVDDTPAPVPPAPVITSGPSGTTPEHGATFEFGSDAPGVTYECSLDGATYTACTPPTSYDNLTDGEHTFRVRTRDADGNVSEPATRTWTVSTQAVAEDDIAFLGGGFGGCSASGGDASLIMLSLGTLVTLARRRRRQG
ncbi:adventurous gliding motility protein AgmC [Melittangium boletus]|uniref:Adhesin n=1 Tax=Melittangium boletus DSM 14713 TaxID=1294270 RepID=A0A250IHM1_9BACT|nr:Ig-like domain-containing protein [Melittangium boletus]ATB30661.1 adhesin [Melittangium boletus DSM 14713]